MQRVFDRVLEKKKEAKLSWDEIAKKAHIRLGSWMTGVLYSSPTDEELRRIAPVLDTTYDYLKYGK